MAEKPIQFSTPMVQAILDGKKTMTRRVAHFPEDTHSVEFEDGKFLATWGRFDEVKNVFVDGETEVRPRYRVGDILWVKETWCEYARVDEHGYTHYDDCSYYYVTEGSYQIDLYDADGFLLDDQRMKWRPPRYMPRAAARIFLRVTDARVERLQEIVIEDAKREGALSECKTCIH